MTSSIPMPVVTGNAVDLAQTVLFLHQVAVVADTGAIYVGDGVHAVSGLIATAVSNLPVPSAGDAGKVVTVKQTENGYELDSVPFLGTSTAATTPGTVVKKIEVFGSNGVSLGFLAIYDAIT